MATVKLTPESLESTLDDNGIVLIDFWAEWCGPCRAFAPVYEAAARKHQDIVFAKVNTEEEQQLAGMFRVSAIPTLVAFRAGIAIFNQAGALPPAALEELIGKIRELDMDAVRAAIAEQEKELARGARPG
jgi:thioredoxin 1